MPSPCQILQKEYAELEKLQQKFEEVFAEAVETNDLSETKKLKKEIEEKLASIKEKIIPKEIKAIFKNPETNEKKEIIINLQEKIKESQAFYQKFNLPVPSEKEIKTIWQKNRKEIQKEMETYGYDEMLIIPENLPTTESLNQILIESMPNTETTWKSSNFTEGGGLSGARHTEKIKTRIILCHSDQNIYGNQNANSFAKQTLNKDIMELSGLDQTEIEKRIQNQENIPINFKTTIQNKEIEIQAEGLSLNEYLIFQRQYFEKTNNHLDEKGWTWLLKTLSASRVVDSNWLPDNRRLLVHADDLVGSYARLSCRLSRSFEN